MPLPEVSAVCSWQANQIPLSARSSFLSGPQITVLGQLLLIAAGNGIHSTDQNLHLHFQPKYWRRVSLNKVSFPFSEHYRAKHGCTAGWLSISILNAVILLPVKSSIRRESPGFELHLPVLSYISRSLGGTRKSPGF